MTNPSPDTSAADVVARLRHLISLNEPRNGGPYAGIAAEACMKAMADAIKAIDASRAETAAAKARAEALSVRCADLSDDLRGEEMVRRFIEAKLAKAVEALRPFADAANAMEIAGCAVASVVDANECEKARSVLTEIEGKSK